jgi:hypothetical protein
MYGGRVVMSDKFRKSNTSAEAIYHKTIIRKSTSNHFSYNTIKWHQANQFKQYNQIATQVFLLMRQLK